MSKIFFRLLTLAIFLAAGLSMPVLAQDHEQTRAPGAVQFAEDVIAHEGHIKRLGAVRGKSMPDNDTRTLEGVSRLLNRAFEPPPQLRLCERRPTTQNAFFRRWKKSCGGWVPYPENSAILFVAIDNQSMRSYLIDGDGLAASAETATDIETLRSAAINLRFALDVDGIENVRAPRLRSAPVHTPRKSSGDEIIDEATAELTELMFPPAISEALKNVDHLVIVSNGVIASIPFPLLPFGEGMMVDYMTVSTAAGMYDLDMIMAPWDRDAFTDILVVADPKVPTLSEWEVPALEGARREGREVAGVLDASLLVGEDALKSEVAARARDLDLLYIAAHGVSDPENPLDGGLLMLAGPNENEALWTGREIQDSVMARTQLVVLSACQTGLGMPHEGGMIGLARSFQKAGVPRVVMSLWSVDDQSTYFMMTRFNGYLAEHRPAEALRLAMLDAREEFTDPRLWSAFTVFGTPR